MCLSENKNVEIVKKIIDTMFDYIRDSSLKRDPRNSFPSRQVLLDCVNCALREILEYAKKYGILISERDSVKIFAFTILCLIRDRDRCYFVGNDNKQFNLDDQALFYACIKFMADAYGVSLTSSLPDIKNTLRILSEMAVSDDRLATYTYLKGLQECCLACKKKRVSSDS